MFFFSFIPYKFRCDHYYISCDLMNSWFWCSILNENVVVFFFISLRFVGREIISFFVGVSMKITENKKKITRRRSKPVKIVNRCFAEKLFTRKLVKKLWENYLSNELNNTWWLRRRSVSKRLWNNLRNKKNFSEIIIDQSEFRDHAQIQLLSGITNIRKAKNCLFLLFWNIKYPICCCLV